jgi:hypothetical protein
MIVALQIYFSHPSLVIYFFGTPLIKLECIYVATTNSKSPGPIIMFDQSKTGSNRQIVFITRFSSKCTDLLHILPASANYTYMQEQKIDILAFPVHTFFAFQNTRRPTKD